MNLYGIFTIVNKKKICLVIGIFLLTVNCSLVVKADSEHWIKPVEGTIPNPFGNNYEFYNVYRAGHTGVDIAASIGTPVHAVDNGIVRYIKTRPNMRYGNYIVLEHENNIYTLYGHLKNVMVTIDEKINQGDIIGHTGISGLASYPHLHFEVTDSVPVRDGAWGYNYICDRRSEEVINRERDKRLFFEKLPVYDFLPLTTIQEKFAFLKASQKHIEHFYRMEEHICVEKKISPITYYNPENYLPRYERSIMPQFGIHHHI